MRYVYFFLFNLLVLNSLNAQTGCPGCVIDLPTLPEDTIYLAPAPDGEVALFYDQDISFRMPKSTDPVNANDPNVPAGIDINDVKILAVANLPPGLGWESSMTNFDVSGGETDGCVKICGTPLISGEFEVEVIVEATVAIIAQTASFSFSLVILPATSSNNGFSMTNNSGCGEVTVSFTNNNPSNGEDGFTYFWDFGNGNSTVIENPSDQFYSEPGVYEVSYAVEIDTSGYILTSVEILNDDCGDLIGGADLYIKIKDPDGNTIFQSNTIDDTPIPFTFNTNLTLNDPGAFKLEVRDEDLFGDENCGDFFFTQFEEDTLVNGGTMVVLNIFHPIFNFETTDTITVHEQPANPVITPANPATICEGEIVDLISDYSENLQWYQDTILLFGDTLPILEVTDPGNYWVQFTSPEGCQAVSEMVFVDFYQNPAIPIFSNDNNLLSLNDLDELPINYSLQWWVQGMPIQFANDPVHCMEFSGEYTLVVTDLDTGCDSQYSFAYSYNENEDCSGVNTGEVLTEEIGLKIFPNPSYGIFNLEMNLENKSAISIEILDLKGRIVFQQNENFSGAFLKQFDLENQASGIYFLRLIIDNQLVTRKVVIE